MPHRSAAGLIAALAALLAAPAAGALQAVPIGEFDAPTGIAAPPGDAHRLFVAQEGGAIDVVHDGTRRRFLTLDPASVTTGREDGLLSLAFAPDYAKSGLLYVYYTAPRPGDPDGNVGTLAEYRRSASDSDAADPASRRVVLTVDHPGRPDHNGGQLQFGPDGLLYLSTGDGGGDNDLNAQNPDVPLGKILRSDARAPVARPELYALGLRNPWRFSFDPVSGDLLVADVGHHQREEVDRVPRGAAAALNFGWPCREGTIPGPRDCAGSFVDPVVEYDHGGGRCAVTGGYVVRDHDIDSVYGRYLYVDLCGGDVRGALVGPGGVTDDAPTGLVMPRVFTFGEDGCGHLYLGREDGTVAELLEDRYETPKPCPEPKRPPAEPPARDRVAPRLTVARRFRQHLAPHRSLYVTVRCSERCAVTAAARIRVPGRAAPLKAARTLPSLARGRRVTVRLLLAPRAASAARRAMNAGKALRGRIRVTARDAAGNRSVRTRPVLVFP